MVKMKAHAGQTHVHNKSKVYEVLDGVVEVPEDEVETFQTLGFTVMVRQDKESKKGEEGDEEEDDGKEEGGSRLPPHLRPAKRR